MSHDAADTHRALIHLYFLFPEIGHLLEGVDGDEHRADVCLVRLRVKGGKIAKRKRSGSGRGAAELKRSSGELAEASVEYPVLTNDREWSERVGCTEVNCR